MSNPTWQDLYNAALLEFDLDKLPERVEAACQAIHQHRVQKGHTLAAEEHKELDDRVVARHEIGERIIISRGFCLENQTFSFQYPFSGAFWTFCSPKRRFSAVATMSGCLRSCSAKSRSLTTTSPVG